MNISPPMMFVLLAVVFSKGVLKSKHPQRTTAIPKFHISYVERRLSRTHTHTKNIQQQHQHIRRHDALILYFHSSNVRAYLWGVSDAFFRDATGGWWGFHIGGVLKCRHFISFYTKIKHDFVLEHTTTDVHFTFLLAACCCLGMSYSSYVWVCSLPIALSRFVCGFGLWIWFPFPFHENGAERRVNDVKRDAIFNQREARRQRKGELSFSLIASVDFSDSWNAYICVSL